MEAPEKIYIQPNIGGRELIKTWFPVKIDQESIEYAHKDVFIKKVCEFINKANLYLYYCINEECDLVDTDKMIEDFKAYIEGE